MRFQIGRRSRPSRPPPPAAARDNALAISVYGREPMCTSTRCADTSTGSRNGTCSSPPVSRDHSSFDPLKRITGGPPNRPDRGHQPQSSIRRSAVLVMELAALRRALGVQFPVRPNPVHTGHIAPNAAGDWATRTRIDHAGGVAIGAPAGAAVEGGGRPDGHPKLEDPDDRRSRRKRVKIPTRGSPRGLNRVPARGCQRRGKPL